MTLTLYNTLTRRKEPFVPIDARNIRMYVCGPTVYDRPHLGNARSVVVYDVLYRLLCHLYGKEHVTYVRNITDVDDKINAAAKANGEPISALTSRIEGYFHADMDALNVLRPTKEPHATQHIAQMVSMIEKLIAGDHAYESAGHVLFRVTSYKEYGALSGRKLEDLIAGARVEVESYKQHPGDFVLWKPAEAGDDPSSVFQSPWGPGRPGWHIECSAMSGEYLGRHFDIHGGGADLMFPHHENEIAQSRCAEPGAQFANVWVHNGFLTVNGEKMSKSLGNFTTVKDVLDKDAQGEVIRFALLKTKYSEPLDWSDKLLSDAKKELDYFYRVLKKAKIVTLDKRNEEIYQSQMPPLFDDMNTPGYIGNLNHLANQSSAAEDEMYTNYYAALLKQHAEILGILQQDPDDWLKGFGADYDRKLKADLNSAFDEATSKEKIESLINTRIEAKKTKNWAEADRIRKELLEQGIVLEDKPDGTTDWRRT